MTSIEKLEIEINKIKQRNKRVEADKAWETSYTRKGFLVLCTYLAVGFYLQAIGVTNPWVNAIVPALAFLLSTLTLSFFKKLWFKYIYKKR